MSKKRSALIISAFLAILILSVKILFPLQENENKRFENYTNHFFRQEVSSNTIALHYTLKDPAAYGITHAPVSMGYYPTDAAAIGAYTENVLASLHDFRRSKLSGKNKLTYDVLDNYLSGALALAPFTLYEEPLAPLTGTQAQLPILLSEYQFYNRSDVDTYLELLTRTPEYFQSLIDFEKARSEAGLFMSASAADQIIQECTAFVNMGEKNYLFSSFEDRIRELSKSLEDSETDNSSQPLSEKEIKNYISENASRMKDYVFPAYITLSENMQTLRDTGRNEGGLCHFPKGTAYYEQLVRRETGSSRSIAELKALTRAHIKEDLQVIQKTLASGSPDAEISVTSDLFKSQGKILEDTNPASILASLKKKLDNNFPAPPKVSAQIKYVQKSMEEYLSPAFYMIPAIDNIEENVIYINAGHIPDDISLFTTLAHEGYPGHLYQNIYYGSRHPAPVRSLLSFGGYTEGWATYSEMLSYYFAPLAKDYATLTQRNSSILLGLYALADIGIHYDGWSLQDTISFFKDYGITDSDTIGDIYNLIVSDPANYLKYYIGYVEFLELKKAAVEKWGKDFSQKRFHKAVLDIGPASFDVVRKYIF